MEDENSPIAPDKVTLTFNLARIKEERGKFVEAIEIYHDLLSDYPEYVDCLLRLGNISRQQGNRAEAESYFARALLQDADCADAHFLLAEIALAKGDSATAKSHCDRILKRTDVEQDAYALVSMGNLYLRVRGKNDFSALDKAGKHFRKALGLQGQHGNAFAANGIGAILAEMGRYDLAKQAFLQVRESTTRMPEVWINLANIFMDEEQYEKAVTLYEKVLNSKQTSRQLREKVMLYLAKTYYQQRDWTRCRQVLCQALQLNPRAATYWYNLAIVQEEFAVHVFQSKLQMRTVHDVEQAHAALQQAIAIQKRLVSDTNMHHTAISQEKFKVHQEFCEASMANANKHLEHAREKQAKEKTKRDAEHQEVLKVNQARLEAEAETRRLEAEIAEEQGRIAAEKNKVAAEASAEFRSNKQHEAEIARFKSDGMDEDSPTSETSSSSSSRKKGRKRAKPSSQDSQLASDYDEENDDDDEDEDDEDEAEFSEQRVKAMERKQKKLNLQKKEKRNKKRRRLNKKAHDSDDDSNDESDDESDNNGTGTTTTTQQEEGETSTASSSSRPKRSRKAKQQALADSDSDDGNSEDDAEPLSDELLQIRNAVDECVRANIHDLSQWGTKRVKREILVPKFGDALIKQHKHVVKEFLARAVGKFQKP